MMVKIEYDSEEGLILPLSDELCKEMNFNIGDILEWKSNKDGTFTLMKSSTRYGISQMGEEGYRLDAIDKNDVSTFIRCGTYRECVEARDKLLNII